MLPPAFGRIGFLGGHTTKHNIQERGTCNLASGDLYTYPTASTTVDATQSLTFKWNTACPITSPSVDLYLYEPTSSTGLIHVWEGVTFADGQYTATLLPKWWNDTTTASLQMSIIQSGLPAWDTTSAAGPVFAITYAASAMYSTTKVDGSVQTSTAAAAATQSQDAVFQNVASTGSHKGISKGAIAAAVVVPLLVLGVVATVAVRFWRLREAEKRRRWSQALSTHSNLEWEKGAISGEKTARPSTQMGRPGTMHSARAMSIATSSVYGVENNMAGAGAGSHFARTGLSGLRSNSADNVEASNTNSMRSSVIMPDGQVRQSRISFADIARPDRRSRLSLGGDLRSAVGIPGVFGLPSGTKSATDLVTPSRKSAAYATDDYEEEMNISPSQVQGPQAMVEAEMRRVADKQRTGRRSIMSLGGGDKRRESTASALNPDDFKTAAIARGSVDELRDMEAVMLMRRSMISQNSVNSPSPESVGQFSNPPTPDGNAEEDLDAPGFSSTPSAPAPTAGSSTVAYGPDQMLAVYASRGKVAAAPSQPLRVLTTNMPGAPAPGDMRSYVHLNRGTVSATVVDALPPPGPRSATSPTNERPAMALRVPTQPGSRMSGASETSAYSEEGEIGNAQ